MHIIDAEWGKDPVRGYPRWKLMDEHGNDLAITGPSDKFPGRWFVIAKIGSDRHNKYADTEAQAKELMVVLAVAAKCEGA